MHELTFTVSKIYPPTGTKPALILAGEGKPGIKVWGDKWKDSIAEGATLTAKGTMGEYNGRQEFTVKEWVGEPSKPNGAAAPVRGGKSPEEESRMIAMGHAIELCALRGNPGTKSEIRNALIDLRDAWLEVFGDKDPLVDATDEIPFP
jgi:hypothetical protein